MTEEEISEMTREEAMEAFAVETGKHGLEAEYRGLKVALMFETQNPDLTAEQRQLLSRILAEL
jgi:hypothetical protein